MEINENTQEFVGNEGEMNTQLPEGAAAEPVDEKVWNLLDGTECSKSSFIREQFTVCNLSRAQISEQFDIPYRTVYGATVNMVNEAEPTSRGRGVVNSKVAVTAEGFAVVTADGGKILVNGVELEAGIEAPETTLVDRNTWIKEQVEKGVSRGDVAKALNISYGVIYNMTKEAEGTRQKHEVEVDGKLMSRNEYIRMRYAEGVSKAAIAKELNVEYSVVWGATKLMKTDAEKYAELLEKLEKFTALVAEGDKETFAMLLVDLKTIVIEEEKAPAPAADPESPAEPSTPAE